MNQFLKNLENQLDNLKTEGLFKEEREITSPQQATITIQNDRKVLNMCSNNYLGLANNPEVIDAAKKGFDHYGFGMSSVRFICGTQSIHHLL